MLRFRLNNQPGSDNNHPERRHKPRQAHQSHSILVVDDSVNVVHALSKVLEQDGYEVLVAGDGEEALMVAEIYQPELILMDVIMPGMDGFQATRQLRKLPEMEATPIIMISDSEHKTDEFWLRKLGANDFLSKPVARGQLFPAIEKQLYSQVA